MGWHSQADVGNDKKQFFVQPLMTCIKKNPAAAGFNPEIGENLI